MDRGAARSRKRDQQQEKAVPKPLTAKSSKAGPSSEAGPSKQPTRPERPPKKVKAPVEPQSRDPELYKPKAIRGSTALIWSQTPFDFPPPREKLEGITRLDLGGSGCTDISWMEGLTGIRWLSLNGCKIDRYKAVGSLTDLTVLNLNDCGLKVIPRPLQDLKNLKAFVAMNNEWTELDSSVVSAWKELNSLIVSHSPNLASLPSGLAKLNHLSKLTFSHCPRIAPAAIPDLSRLPLLRDVKMNNLPLLTALPQNISSWGKGGLSLVITDSPDTAGNGAGLENVDLGNCSLPASTLPSFVNGSWSNLRSLTLHSNPLCAETANYSELLQQGKGLPKLQIVDNKRVVEKKKSKDRPKKGKSNRVKPTGSNQDGGKMRAWGRPEEVAVAHTPAADAEGGKVRKRKREDEDAPRKKRDRANGDIREKSKKPALVADKVKPNTKKPTSKPEGAAGPAKEHSAPRATVAAHPAVPTPARTAVSQADPSALSASAPSKGKKPSKTETSVLGVIDIAGEKKGKKDRREKRDDAVDLKAMFSKPSESGSGLGVGGW